MQDKIEGNAVWTARYTDIKLNKINMWQNERGMMGWFITQSGAAGRSELKML